ncbi:MAG: dual specificity protein phosphatase family protein [Thaumarchaeota archaeon]|nr:dual specificity protein phosphatase family protein [Nitrososphaerota archaeon]RNJ73549.1 MAG: protein tyrosine phosphatase [Thaumarchaeota archaeon S13]RNJ74219.1 MAG: protein tyrosine phosphatase [Thaumarchaeota archaeon S14]MDD9809244.1 dual specificity protein phosphatase family protein [Nitrososphaerota archaeon]MDD9814118.1 dual specificity protein phosphatase family protein [Nitrososphaerota archaeon]
MSRPGNAWRRVRGRITGRPANFSWVIEGGLAGSAAPTSRAELEWARGEGVASVVTMTEDALPPAWTAGLGGYLHVPTPDLEAPTDEGIDRAVDFAHSEMASGRRVMVHCAAGMGRAGTILACYLVRHAGLTAGEAIARIRRERPGSIQSPPQERAIERYAERHGATRA